VVKLIASAVVLAAFVGGSAQGAVPVGNLVANGGAEGGAGSPDGGVVPVPGWATIGSFTVVQYGASGFPQPQPGGGANFFAGGPQSPSSAGQTIDLSAAQTAIDAGRVDVRVGALVSKPAGGAATLVVGLLDANGQSLSGRNLASSVTDRFSQVGARLPVPPGTRTVTIAMKASSPSSGYNDALFDNVSLTLAGRRIPRPERGKTVVMTPSKGRVVLYRRGNRKITTHPVVVPIGHPVVIPLGTVVDTSAGTATITSATDRYGSETARGSFSQGVFAVDQTGSDTAISLGGNGPRLCSRPRRLLTRAPGHFMVLAGASASRASSQVGGRPGTAVWVAEDRCTASTIQSRSGMVDVAALGSRRASARQAHRLFGRGAFRTSGRYSSATVRGRISGR
jgi:hypothetical protein